MTRLHDGEEVLSHTVPVVFTDPLVDFRFVYRFRTLVFPDVGSYEFALLSGSEQLASTRVDVALLGGAS